MGELEARAFADVYLHPYYRQTKDGLLRRRIDVYNNPNTRGWTPEGSFLLLTFKLLQNYSRQFSQLWGRSTEAIANGNDPKRHDYRVVLSWVSWAIPHYPQGGRSGEFYVNDHLVTDRNSYLSKMDTVENLGSPEWRRRYAPNLTAYAWPSRPTLAPRGSRDA